MQDSRAFLRYGAEKCKVSPVGIALVFGAKGVK
jgi:hypothetical protein